MTSNKQKRKIIFLLAVTTILFVSGCNFVVEKEYKNYKDLKYCEIAVGDVNFNFIDASNKEKVSCKIIESYCEDYESCTWYVTESYSGTNFLMKKEYKGRCYCS